MSGVVDKNEPGRFLGDGVSFRAKLIGVLEVAEARGDRMCQEALGDLKMAVRAAGEHKQRIQVHVAIDGLRLRDDKTGDSLYHHPVHKISFIAQDMSDSRAFGYIFGSPDTGHRFFGIKTDKAASQVVIAMRDLFQVVFELKKKEIELAKLQLEGKSSVSSTRLNICLDTIKTKNLINPSADLDVSNLKLLTDPTLKLSESAGTSSCSNVGGGGSGGAVAELVDLEQELSSLRRGLHQMEGLTPPSGAPVTGGTDPFGDSFTSLPSLTKGLLPPPPSGVSRDSRSRSCTSTTPSVSSQPNTSYSPAKSSGILSSAAVGFKAPPFQTNTIEQANDSAAQMSYSEPTPEQTANIQQSSLAFDVFMELDPLGTGRSKPYVDKKHFFQELKNPPKKVLKDLVSGSPSLLDASPSIAACIDSSLNEPLFGTSLITTLRRQSSGRNPLIPSNSVPLTHTVSNAQNNQLFDSDPFAETDPFDSADPFSESSIEDPFANSPALGSFRDTSGEISSTKEGELETNNAEDYSLNQKKDENGRVFVFSHKLDGRRARVGAVFNGPLQVSLPPEQQSPKSPLLTRQTSPHKKHSTLYKQRSLLGKPTMYTQHIPSPPPPLPPKPSAAPLDGTCLKPPPRPPHSDTDPADSGSETGPPLPNPSRRWGNRPPLRVNKPNLTSMNTNSSEDEYLTPIPPSAVNKGAAPGLDITITQLLTCGLEDLALKMNVPASQLSSMTLAQLTAYLTDFLETSNSQNNTADVCSPPKSVAPKVHKYGSYSNHSLGSVDFRANFEDNFFSRNNTTTTDTFVANFDDFNKKLDPSFDRYAVFREIQDKDLKVMAPDSQDGVEEFVNNEAEYHSLDFETKVNKITPEISTLTIAEKPRKSRSITPTAEKLSITENPAPSKSVIKDVQLDTFSAFQSTMQKVSPCKTKLDDLKAAIKKLQISENSSKSPITVETNEDPSGDRYAALREITIIESSPTEFDIPAVPPEGPKERKRSDEKSDGFDNSDFFDCIDNSSLSLSHAEDAFRKSPLISKSPLPRASLKKDEPMLPPQSPANLMPQTQTPAPNSAGSMSDIVSGSSPETAHKEKACSRQAGSNDSSGGGDAPHWGAFLKRRSPRSDDAASPWSSDSKDSRDGGQADRGGRRASGGDPPPPLPRPRRRPPTKSWNTRQTSSSSRDVSPWEEEPPPPPRSHTRSLPHHRERHGSSREHLDSGNTREREKEKRDSRDSGSISGRDRELSRDRDRDHGRQWDEHREDRRRSRERDREWDVETRDRDREYSRESSIYREPKVRERTARDKDIHSRDREKERSHRRPRHHSWVDDEEYSEGPLSSNMGVSGEVSRSASREFRERWEAWSGTDERMYPPRRDDRGYNTVGWRGEARRRAEASRQSDTPNSRYSNTLRGRWSSGSRSSRDRDSDPLGGRTQRYGRSSRTSRSPHRESPPRSRRHHRETRRHQSSEEPAKTSARYRFSNDFSTERDSPRSPFENDFVETPCSSSSKKYREDLSAHERQSPRVSERGFSSERYRVDEERAEVNRSPSPVSATRYEVGRVHALLQNEDSPTPQTGRFRFDSDSVSPRSLFEDDFATELRNGSQPQTSRSAEPNLPCSEVIAEEDESGTKSRGSSDKNVGFEVPSRPRSSDPRKSNNRIKPRSRPDPDIKKSESVNIFVRDKDPFDGDDFFCTGSDKAGRRENWPGDFPAFDDV